MKLAKTLLIMSIVLALLMTHINAITEEENEGGEEEISFNNEMEEEEEDVPPFDSNSPSFEAEQPSLYGGGLGRFLLSKKSKRKPLKCNKNPLICKTKGSAGPHCCKKKCVDVRTDRHNCGLCGKKCKYNETCCNGKCVNLSSDNRHCGRCDNRCGNGDFCLYGLCNYA